MIELSNHLYQILCNNLKAEELEWLLDRAGKIKADFAGNWLFESFSRIPTAIKQHKIKISKIERHWIVKHPAHLKLDNWETTKLCRLYLLNDLPVNNKQLYLEKVNELFDWAEVKELVALYSSLPILAFPSAWISKCKEGIRSNVGDVLKAIMYCNSYPSRYLDEPSWNQMVCKAFITQKSIRLIIGLTDRANLRLANMLIDYISEQLSAKRYIDPEIAPLVTPYLSKKSYPLIEQLFESEETLYILIASIICLNVSTLPSLKLMVKYQHIVNPILRQDISWADLINRYVY